MTYSDAIRFLYNLRWFGAKLGLDNTFKLAALAGNPQHQLRFIHVAGTNGKGSVSAMIAGSLRAAGLRVGLYTSPHLHRFVERVRVDGAPLGAKGLLFHEVKTDFLARRSTPILPPCGKSFSASFTALGAALLFGAAVIP